MGGGDLNMKKTFHPLTWRNQEKIWKAEQRAATDEKKKEEIKKTLREERQIEELRRVQAEAGLTQRKERLDWMYEGGLRTTTAEDFLLGKPVEDNNKNNELKKLEQVPGSLMMQGGSTTALPSARDQLAKMKEDPLVMIRQKEIELKKHLLKNPLNKARILEQLQEQLKSSKSKHKHSDSNDDTHSDKHRHKDHKDKDHKHHKEHKHKEHKHKEHKHKEEKHKHSKHSDSDDSSHHKSSTKRKHDGDSHVNGHSHEQPRSRDDDQPKRQRVSRWDSSGPQQHSSSSSIPATTAANGASSSSSSSHQQQPQQAPAIPNTVQALREASLAAVARRGFVPTAERSSKGPSRPLTAEEKQQRLREMELNAQEHQTIRESRLVSYSKAKDANAEGQNNQSARFLSEMQAKTYLNTDETVEERLRRNAHTRQSKNDQAFLVRT